VSSYLYAVKDSVYTAVFGAKGGETSAGVEEDTNAISEDEVQEVQRTELSPWAAAAAIAAIAASAPEKVQDALSALVPAAVAAEPVAEPTETSGEVAEAEEALQAPTWSWSTPWAMPEELASGTGDLFLFIKDYAWSLRYRVLVSEEEGVNVDKPLALEWVKLRRPPQTPEELFGQSGSDLFDWSVREPAKHHGFMYSVVESASQGVVSGVEAVINFFKGRGPNILVQPDGIRLAGQSTSTPEASEEDDENQQKVTHCWVEVGGWPFLPALQSIAFFNLQEIVMDYHA